MVERLSHELAWLLAEEDGRSDQSEAVALLRARLAGDMVEAVGSRNSAHTGKIDCAVVAAFLDCRLSSREWDAMAARIVEDAVARLDMVSAAALLDDIADQPVKVPAGLAAQAVQVLTSRAARGPIRPPARAFARLQGLAWLPRAFVWSGAAIVAAMAILAALWLVRDGSAPRPSLNAKNPDVLKRGDETPARIACGDQDAQGQGQGQGQVQLSPRGPIARAKKNKKPAGGAGDDPCPPVSPDAGKNGRGPSPDQK